MFASFSRSMKSLAEAQEEEKVEREEEDDRFYCLADEVLRLILNKVSDPKSLLRCSLVSKRLASILSDSHSLSLQIPSPIPLPTPISPNHRNLYSSNPNNHLSTRLLSFLTIPFRFLHQFVAHPPPPSELDSDDALLLLLTKLLRKFDDVRSLRVEIPCSCHCNIKFRSRSSFHDDEQSTVFKWKAKLGLKIEPFTFLLPTLIRKIDDENHDVEDEGEPPAFDWLNRGYGKAFRPMYYAFSMHRVLLLLIVQHPKLTSVVITDSKKQGKLSLEGQELVELRNLLNSSPKKLELANLVVLPQHFKLWYVPELQLPVSGYVMERATLVVFRGVGAENRYDDRAEDDDVDVIAGGFEDDRDGIYGEAVTEILANHKDKLKLSL